MRFYVGCGSRNAPEPILKLMTLLAGVMADRGVHLHTSEEPGPDAAFRRGSRGKFWTFIPDNDSGESICGITSDLTPGGAAVTLARRLNPAFVAMSQQDKRWEIVGNSVMLGMSADNGTAKLLITWTPDGAVDSSTMTPETGHVARYLKLAERYGVPVINLARREHRDKVKPWLAPKHH